MSVRPNGRHAGFWVVFGLEEISRYWCAHGTMDPNSQDSVNITSEINPSSPHFRAQRHLTRPEFL
jgi:hypothetical protein